MPRISPPPNFDAQYPLSNILSFLYFLWVGFIGITFTIPFATFTLIHLKLKPSVEAFHFWAKHWARWILKAIFIRVECDIEAKLDKSVPYVCISNHQNALDILVHAGYVPIPFSFLAKAELQSMPFIGAVLSASCIFVDRSTPRKAIESIQKAGARVKSGQSVLVYPEGERTWSPHLVPFMRGAFEIALAGQVPLLPITLFNAYSFLDERNFRARPGTIKLKINEPVSLVGKKRKDLPSLIETIEANIQNDIYHLPRSDHKERT